MGRSWTNKRGQNSRSGLNMKIKLWGRIVTGIILVAGVVIGIVVSGLWFVVSEPQTKIRVNLEPIATPTPTPKVITVAAVGDVMLGRRVREQMIKKKDWSWPFRETAARLAQADITIGNLEAPMVTGCRQHDNRMVFCMNPEAREGLTLAGFDVLTLANNHMLNYGQEGLADTHWYLEQAEMQGTYDGELVMEEVGGQKIGFLGFDDVTQTLDLDEVSRQIGAADQTAGIVVAMVHWGNEYMASPSARQRQVGGVMARAGADLIIGSHPHWVQNVEKLGETLIFWSLGNFVFDQMWSEETRSGAIALLELKFQNSPLRQGLGGQAKLKTLEYELLPVRIYEYGQPRWK